MVQLAGPRIGDFTEATTLAATDMMEASLAGSAGSRRVLLKNLIHSLITSGGFGTVSVKDPRFGAVGDGIADDTAAIQAALDAATNGQTVLCPLGTYKTTAVLTVSGKSRVTLAGEGPGSLITTTAATHDIILINDTCDWMTVEKLRITGVSVGEEGFAAVRCKSPHSTVRFCEISDINAGILFSAGNYFTGWEGCAAYGNYLHDIKGSNSGSGYGVYTDCPLTVVSNNRFKSVGRHDVYISGNAIRGADGTSVVGNVSEDNGVECIGTNAPANQPPLVGLEIVGNSILNPRGYAIGLSVNTWGAVVANNSIDGVSASSGFAPITVDGGSVLLSELPMYNIITNNAITRNEYDEAIRLLNASYCIVTHNVMDAAVRGIMVTSTGTPPLFPTGNVISENVAVPGIVPVVIDVSCLDTTVGTNFGTVASSIGNNRNVIHVTDHTVGTVAIPDTDKPVLVKFEQTGTQTITDFTGGREGTILTVYFNSTDAVTLTNAHMFFRGGATSFVSTQFDTLSLIRIGANWVQRASEVN